MGRYVINLDGSYKLTGLIHVSVVKCMAEHAHFNFNRRFKFVCLLIKMNKPTSPKSIAVFAARDFDEMITLIITHTSEGKT